MGDELLDEVKAALADYDAAKKAVEEADALPREAMDRGDHFGLSFMIIDNANSGDDFKWLRALVERVEKAEASQALMRNDRVDLIRILAERDALKAHVEQLEKDLSFLRPDPKDLLAMLKAPQGPAPRQNERSEMNDKGQDTLQIENGILRQKLEERDREIERLREMLVTYMEDELVAEIRELPPPGNPGEYGGVDDPYRPLKDFLAKEKKRAERAAISIQERVNRMRAALEKAREALRMDAMADIQGQPFSTTKDALEAIHAALHPPAAPGGGKEE